MLPASDCWRILGELCEPLLRSDSDETVRFLGDSSRGNIVLAVMLKTLEISSEVASLANVMLIAQALDLHFRNRRTGENKERGRIRSVC